MIGGIVASLCVRVAGQGSGLVLDQAHDEDWSEAIHRIQAYPLVAQEFTPAVGGLDFVEVFTRDWSFPVTNGVGATLQVLLREGSVTGGVLAASSPRELPDGWVGPTNFWFTNIVWLETGRQYAFEVKVLEGNPWGIESYGTFAPPYDGGRYFLGTNIMRDVDLWFRTGVRVPRPELRVSSRQAIEWAGIPPLAYSVLRSTDLTKWVHAGFVDGTSTNYAFTNVVAGERAFYRVTFP